jgi:hypothetical protein
MYSERQSQRSDRADQHTVILLFCNNSTVATKILRKFICSWRSRLGKAAKQDVWLDDTRQGESISSHSHQARLPLLPAAASASAKKYRSVESTLES